LQLGGEETFNSIQQINQEQGDQRNSQPFKLNPFPLKGSNFGPSSSFFSLASAGFGAGGAPGTCLAAWGWRVKKDEIV